MIGTITRILAKAGWKSMNGPLADERRRLAGAVAPAAYASYDPRLMAGAGWYGYRISFKGGDRSMLEAARYLLREQYVVREMYDQYTDNVYSLGVVLRQRVRLYGIVGGSQPHPDALNFYMPDGGTVTLTKKGSPTVVELEYSIDGGATWHIWEEVGNVRSLTLAAGQKMYIRNTSETETGFSTSYNNNQYLFVFDSPTVAAGKIKSLLVKEPGNTPFTTKHAIFCNLFYDQINLIDVSRIVIYVQTGTYKSFIFQSMFKGTGITTSPEIIVANNLNNCGQGLFNMFCNCTNLNKIIFNCTSYSGSACLEGWVSGVAATGDFYCPAELTIPTGISGIPTGWTRHDI